MLEGQQSLKIWPTVKEQIAFSRIERMPWKAIFGESLTRVILREKAKGLTATEAFHSINDLLVDFKRKNPAKARKVEHNLRISVAARYGENNTAIHVFKEERRA